MSCLRKGNMEIKLFVLDVDDTAMGMHELN